ncbi:MAG: nuclease-related domain-containing protein [archaeon]|nr:nuclease-related domain-containing protein [archaeon]MDA1167477.1 nuclease-related domain-containing protein [archaeon]
MLDRLRWRMERRIKTEPDTIQRAGESAEFRLGQYLRAAGKKTGWKIYESLRVPQKDGPHRGEIDFVLLHGSDVFSVEQKHWAGTLQIGQDGEFIQQRPNGTSQVHGDVKAKHERKTSDLEHYLLQHHDATDFGIHTWFAFTHPRFEFEASSDLGIDIVNQKEIVERLEQSVNKPQNGNVASSLDALGTWDEVEVYGGRTFKGDVLDLGLSVLLTDLRALTHPLTLIEVSHNRSLLSLFSLSPSIAKIRASTEILERLERHQSIRIHVVGDASPVEIPWSKVTRVHLSN